MKVNSIKELVEVAMDKKGNKHSEYFWGEFPANQSRFVKKHTGHKMIGIPRIIDSSGIRHVLNEHGNHQTEVQRGR